MKRFVWRLQRVLDIKTSEEQTKRTELLELTERLAMTQGELLMQKRILQNVINGLTKMADSGQRIADSKKLNANKRLSEQEFFLKCSATSDDLIKKLANKVSELESAQKQKIADVLKVKRAKEGLEKLRDEAKREFIKEQEKLEQKEMDEQATVSFARKTINDY